MRNTFSTNRSTIVFYALLSVIVVPFGLANLYRAVTGTGGYSIGLRSLIAPVLPLLVYFSYRNGLLVLQDRGLRHGRTLYLYAEHSFSFAKRSLPLKDRPLTSLWKSEYDILQIASRTSTPGATIPIDMSRSQMHRLGEALRATGSLK